MRTMLVLHYHYAPIVLIVAWHAFMKRKNVHRATSLKIIVISILAVDRTVVPKPRVLPAIMARDIVARRTATIVPTRKTNIVWIVLMDIIVAHVARPTIPSACHHLPLATYAMKGYVKIVGMIASTYLFLSFCSILLLLNKPCIIRIVHYLFNQAAL